MKLIVGIPTAGSPTEPFLQSLRSLELPPAITSIENTSVRGNFVPAQRELLAEFAKDHAGDLLLMVDDDMVIPPDAVGKLVAPFEDQSVGIVGALCYSRDGLRPMAVDLWDPEDTTSAAIPAFDDRTPVRVDGVGFGLAVIRMSALGNLKAPYFPAQVYIERKAAQVRICNEDFLFCKRLRDGGWKVLLHPGVRCGHYDRASRQTFPLVWESPEQTNVRRMMVRDASGAIVKIPFDAGVGQTAERHEKAELDYIIVD